MEKLPKAPDHLSPPSAAWWAAIVADYALEPADLRVLEAACTHWDRATAARLEIESKGALVEDRFGQMKPSPAIDIEQQSTRLFLAALRQLGLGLEPPDHTRLPDPAAAIPRG